MSPSLLFLAAAALEGESILVTAAREPLGADEAPVSATMLDETVLEDLSLPAAADLLRLTPGVSVAATGPRGTQTQVRLRGAEAGHTLLFVDGIRFNDPAAGNEARFELLGADLLSRIELVRGPQSALWGAEALGGVVAVDTADPFRARGLAALAEYGRLDSARLFGRYAIRTGDVGINAAAGWQRSDGIDSFGGGGERDGFDQFNATLKAVYRTGGFEAGATGHWVEGSSQFDGFDPVTFLRADTLDETENRIGATRAWASYEANDWSVQGEAAYLDSANRNRLAGAPLNVTFGDRLTFGGQVARQLGSHRLIVAVDHQSEGFRASDTAFGGATAQDRERRLAGLVGEWRAEWSEAVATDVAVRRDWFSAFEDATTVRAALLVRPARGWTLHAAYGEGIAQPTFFDLYGFFPGSFVGNPALAPERSRGWEAGVRWAGGAFSAEVTGFSARLRDEIVDVFDPVTFLSSTENADGTSRRDGVEAALGYRADERLEILANYTFLDADEQRVAGTALLREVRRPRHSFNLIAHGRSGRFRWGTSLAYVGARIDTDFDLVPAATVRLDDHVLASLNIAYRLLPQLELFARAENGFDADYQDVVGYNTPGRTVYAGLRVALGN
ncbi:TonB-dependent siderophore receptor [Sphingosinicella sp. CPCC 101087]|uniref:TonB-dependent receptor plug domain-containing protein n=1 Tax=Sphingosinicella sp. CPCC 101087 TaxID=2497754 RepID=UPI00101C1ABC|nr:TonB-dependent receptor [Sphingosinicella sp. CPCC 101087]